MKIIFLDCDGVLNSDASLMLDDALEESLLLNLKEIVDKTQAQIILSSSWRLMFNPLRRLMNRLNNIGLHLSGLTQNGVSTKWLKKQGIEPTRKYIDVIDDYKGNEIEITTDRGAEITKWLSEHKNVESFVILDDDAFDIKKYFPNNFIQTSFKTGLTKEDVKKAIDILNKNV